MKQCETCNSKNRDDAETCTGCGVSLPKIERQAAKADAPAPRRARKAPTTHAIKPAKGRRIRA